MDGFVGVFNCAIRLHLSKRWVDTAMRATPAMLRPMAMSIVLPFLPHQIASSVDCPAATTQQWSTIIIMRS